MPDHETNTDLLLKNLATQSVRQSRDVRATVRNLTLKSLQQRELTLEQIRRVMRSILEGVSLGLGKREAKIEKTLADTIAGMDDALLKVVEASSVALQRLSGEGYDFEDSNLKRALNELERLEDEFLGGIMAAAASAGEKIREPWERVLERTKVSGTVTGAHAAATLRGYAKQAQAAMRAQRETGFKTAYLLTQNFAILASGVLIGMSEGLGGKSAGPRPKAKPASVRRAPAAKRAPAKSKKRAPAKSKKRAPAKSKKRTPGKTASRARTTTARKAR